MRVIAVKKSSKRTSAELQITGNAMREKQGHEGIAYIFTGFSSTDTNKHTPGTHSKFNI